MTRALTIRDNLDIMTLADVLVKSGFFTDTCDQAKAVVKVLAGQELGFGPIASMTGIHIVQGKPVLSANLMAALVKRGGRYDYRVAEHTPEVCTIAFFDNGEQVGTSQFTAEDAETAGLTNKDNWRKYPKNMLFARALSNGVKWYCPDVLGGPVYTPDEIGMDADEGGDAVIEHEWVEFSPRPTPLSDWVLETRTPKGTLYTDLTIVQLNQVIEKAPAGTREQKAAQIIIDTREFYYHQWTDAIVEAGYADNEFSAIGLLRHSPFSGNELLENVLTWCASYRGARDSDLPVERAAEIATEEFMTEVPI